MLPVFAGVKNSDCLDCHGDNTLFKTNSAGQPISLFVEVARFKLSVHRTNDCISCHADITGKHPDDNRTVLAVDCGRCHARQTESYAASVHGLALKAGHADAATCRDCHDSHEIIADTSPASPIYFSRQAETCGACHDREARDWAQSVHGQAVMAGSRDAPTCTGCHDEHKIRSLKTSSAMAISEDVCSRCHASERLNTKYNLPGDRVKTFFESYHGLAAQYGSTVAANCASCHGFHKILPSSNPNSTINRAHLVATCGKCHPGAGTRFAISQVHVAEGRGEPALLKWVREFYLLLIPVTIGLMMLHQGGDWIRKLIRLRFQPQPAPRRACAAAVSAGAHGDLRMLPFERVQHAVMALSFIVLVWTGFALKYPDSWWARPLLVLESTHPLRSIIHRIAAVVFIAVSVTHLVSLIVSRKLRAHWMEMLPNRRDPREAASGFAYNLGLGSAPPARSAHSYVEKAEYWAVVWGAVVMASTGLLLWANNLAMRFLPKSWLDVATSVHFYEALLATLAIVVWHFYSIIFDPDVYPLNTAFLTGYSSKKSEHSKERHETTHSVGD